MLKETMRRTSVKDIYDEAYADFANVIVMTEYGYMRFDTASDACNRYGLPLPEVLEKLRAGKVWRDGHMKVKRRMIEESFQ